MNKTVVSIIGGLSGMFGWGTSDFFANISSEKIGHTRTLFWSQLAGLVLMAIAALIFAGDFVLTTRLFLLILFGGIAYTIGYLYFYKAFEIGNVSVVSSLVNIQNLWVILIAYFLFHQTLSTLQIPAIIMVLIGATLVSVDFKELKNRGDVSLVRGVKEVIIAASLFGAIYWPLSEYVSERMDWIMFSFLTKLIALGTLLIITTVNKSKLKIAFPSRKLKLTLLAVGLLEALAVLGVNFGLSLGDAILVSPLASALTVVTIGLSVIFLNEKLVRTQWVGIVMTIIGILLTSF